VPESAVFPPDFSLLLAPEDEAHPVGACSWTTRTGRHQTGHAWVVLHRRHGLWTHVYRVVADHRPGRLLAYLEHAVPGEQVAACIAWAKDKFKQEVLF
jgi:hypothetical protein